MRVKPWHETINWPHEELGIEDFSVKVLVFDDEGNVPLVMDVDGKRDPVWAFPGGGVEGAELPPETGSRELEEETGAQVQPEDFYPQTHESVKFFTRVFQNEDNSHIRYFLFAKTSSFIQNLKERGEEGEKVEVFRLEEIADMDDFLPHHKVYLRQLQELIESIE